MKELLTVGIGSFFGGSLRYAVSRLMLLWLPGAFPVGTFVVNVAGCFLIGLFTAMPSIASHASPATRLLLTTGFCGGFTTFSTFINETSTLAKGDSLLMPIAYVTGSLAVGFAAVLLGDVVGRLF